MQLKNVFWIISLSLVVLLFICDCALLSTVPESPEIVQYGVYPDLSKPGFYGVNNKTGELVYRPFTAQEMKAGQCLSADDYKKSEEWVATIKELAQRLRSN